VPGGIWKASRLRSGRTGYGLISEAVTPGFAYEDMSLGERKTLQRRFPKHADLIAELTR
jgi:predicted cupin superfamily sugar epimerase